MALFLQILTTIIFPVFALIGIGVLMDRLFPIDVQTLSKFNFYLFLPAILFVALLKSELNPTLFGTVAGFTLTQLVLLLGISGLLYNTKPFKPHRRLLTIEYQRNPNLASQMILWSTLGSAFTMTVWLMIFR